MKKPFKKLAVGTLFAAAAGYIAGVLTAPKSGKETRDELMAAWAEGEKKLKQLHTELTSLISQAKEQKAKLKGDAQKGYDQAFNQAQKAREKAREVLSAVHEGEVQDKDLKQAIDEAKKAVQHLRAYYEK